MDEQLKPHQDQWTFLAQIKKISQAEMEGIVGAAETRNRVVGVRFVLSQEDDDTPWTTPPSRRTKEPPIVDPLPKSLVLTLGNQIYIAKDQLPAGLHNRLLRIAAFQNPEFYKAQAMRLPTYDKPRIIDCSEDYPKHLGLPRGCLEETQEVLRDLNIKVALHDERCPGNPLNVSFGGTLRPEQQAAAAA
ncbi:MAG: restriction endonuclease subunit R, partial [Lentisphaerota bacterium]